MFSGTSLSDATGIDGGSHGAEGKGERSKKESELRPYKFGEGRITDIRNVSDLGSQTGARFPPLEVWLT